MRYIVLALALCSPFVAVSANAAGAPTVKVKRHKTRGSKAPRKTSRRRAN